MFKQKSVRLKAVLGASCALALLLPACGRKENTIKQAKEAVRTSIARTKQTTGTATASAPSYIDSERYLPTQERLRRRQERLQAVLDKQPKPR